MQYFYNSFAQAYGTCGYGTSSYQTGSCQSTATTGAGSTSSSGGLLTNTGFDLLLAATLACAIIFAALVIRFWKKPKSSGI